jgi:hypothetical protein
MFSLKHISEEDLKRYYYLDGEISGKSQKINILNGVQQNYVGSCINNFITWNDECGKKKFELFVKENLPKLEVEYDKIVKKKQFDETIEKYIIDELLSMNEGREIKNRVLHKFKIPLYKYYNRLHPFIQSACGIASRFELEPDINYFAHPYYILSSMEEKVKSNPSRYLHKPLKWFQEDINIIMCKDTRKYCIKETRKGKKKIYERVTITREQLNKHIEKNKKKFNNKVDKICDNIQNEINMMCLS